MFPRRFASIPVSVEPAAQIARLEYLLSNGCKEGLVLSPRDWPGVQSAGALVDGEPLVGEWIDRTAYRAARNQDPDVSIRQFTERHEVHLEPLPCWKHLEESEWRSRVASMVNRIEEKTLKMHHDQGTVPLGARAARKVHPHKRPNYENRSPRPMVHAFTRKMRDEMIDAYRDFEAAYRLATDLLRSGQWDVAFPPGCWKPHLLVPGPGLRVNAHPTPQFAALIPPPTGEVRPAESIFAASHRLGADFERRIRFFGLSWSLRTPRSGDRGSKKRAQRPIS